jgi:hypothetical protein
MDDCDTPDTSVNSTAPPAQSRRAGELFDGLLAGSLAVGWLGGLAVAVTGSPRGLGAGLLCLAGIVVSFVGQVAGRGGRP